MIQLARFLGLISFSIGMVASQSVLAAKDIKSNYGIIHDSEFQVLLKQKGDDWNAEDKEIEARLDALRKKHGKRPNIIYIMWDDMKYGAIGHEMLNKVTGYSSPNIKELGIADNTLVVLSADNGPMEAAWPDLTWQNPGIFRGGKNDFLEGGVRVPAFAYWPGVIEPGQVVGDMVHVTDLFTTFARLGGAMNRIPKNRVIDGIDQTALLLKGDGNGRRDSVYIYQGPVLAAIVKQQYKRHFAGAAPGLAGKGFFDLYKDPREEHPLQAQFLWSWPAFDHIKDRHEAQIAKYPHTPVTRGEPYTGIERMKR